MEFECLHEQHVNKGIVNGEIKASNVRDRSERPPAHSGVSEQDWPSDELAAGAGACWLSPHFMELLNSENFEANCQFGISFHKTAYIRNLNSSFLT